jgi:hypothetical protein
VPQSYYTKERPVIVNDMNKVIESVKRLFIIRNIFFNSLVIEFIVLLDYHYAALKYISLIKDQDTSAFFLNGLEEIKVTLEKNIDAIICIIGRIINRRILVHITVQGDSIYKLSKKYSSSMWEIFELNKLDDIFILEENKHILVPVKNLESSI